MEDYESEGIWVAHFDPNCSLNCQSHHTDMMSRDRLILRRGQAFDVFLHFQNRGWDSSKDQITFTVETVCKASRHRSIQVSLLIPANACIGLYSLQAQVPSGQGPGPRTLGEFIVLFNPWCPDDLVYLENPSHREEYILNEHGMVFRGLHKYIVSHPWHFGQFEENMVDMCLRVLDMSGNFQRDPSLDCSYRNDPVYVSRVVNSMLCSHSSNSLMKLPRNNDSAQGVNPLAWNGSVPILSQWYGSGCRPVRFGQCSTLAAVMCTVMRCLGIPSRVVTNFYSTQNASEAFIIDEYFDSTGRSLCGKEHIWRHHCWNESWMVRKDLNESCGEWQYLDPTPMETSGGLVCCGPTCVKNIREGDLDQDYDGAYVFSRLNAGRASWLRQASEGKAKVHCDARLFGQSISTKGVGTEEREDITHNYKHQPDSIRGREVFYKAYRRIHPKFLSASNCQIEKELQALRNPGLDEADTVMKFKLGNSPVYGEDINLFLHLANLSHESRDLRLKLSAEGLTYAGCFMEPFWTDDLIISLKPKAEKKVPLQIMYSQYGRHLGDHNLLRVVAVSEPGCKGEIMLVDRDILLLKPPVEIKLRGSPRLNVRCTAEIIFTNPLPESLRNCKLTLEGSNLMQKPVTIELGTLAPRHQTQTLVDLIPFRPGLHRLLANFDCHRFSYCKGYANVRVDNSLISLVQGPR
ncbi:protein-glutamine gamma-glutamyltransferase 5-like [Ornithorhynchus anatinus]|uniref:protein-glutamine gamma-glutamyltransferase 5-like n=1 Tax=Ornithorhynchus anatinus TaxID=9258 RepID=UPI0019D484FC|nr:protein-glutamine gamma-glutamyltransferase 5-like [Ornithorhynchus anatinus]